MAPRNEIPEEFQDKDYRHSYVDDFLDASIAAQIKALRESRGLTQEKLAGLAGMKQSRISVLEDVNYDSWSINTLRKLARAFDVALVVKFESFSRRLEDIAQFNREALLVPAFTETAKLAASHADALQARLDTLMAIDKRATQAAQDQVAALEALKARITKDFEAPMAAVEHMLASQVQAIEAAAKAEVDSINAAVSAALMDNAAAQQSITSLAFNYGDIFTEIMGAGPVEGHSRDSDSRRPYGGRTSDIPQLSEEEIAA